MFSISIQSHQFIHRQQVQLQTMKREVELSKEIQQQLLGTPSFFLSLLGFLIGCPIFIFSIVTYLTNY